MSSSKKVFLIGATGYIGGTVLKSLHDAHPDLKYTLQVRSKDKGEKIKAEYPNIEYVLGDLDSEDVLVKASSEADVVIATADCDHENAVKYIYKGMAQHDGPSYYIHTSGTGILTDNSGAKAGHAKQNDISDKQYDDILDVKDVTSLPASQWHRSVDKIVLEQAPKNVHQAIVCPPLIYGNGTGPINQNSIQIPMTIKEFQKRGHGFTINGSQNVWRQVHVVDLADIYVRLTESALEPNGGHATWGSEGYYFAESGPVDFKVTFQKIADVLHSHGKIDSAELKDYTGDNMYDQLGVLVMMVSLNSKGIASRARKVLGWKPTQPELLQTIEPTVKLTLESEKGKNMAEAVPVGN